MPVNDFGAGNMSRKQSRLFLQDFEDELTMLTIFRNRTQWLAGESYCSQDDPSQTKPSQAGTLFATLPSLVPEREKSNLIPHPHAVNKP